MIEVTVTIIIDTPPTDDQLENAISAAQRAARAQLAADGTPIVHTRYAVQELMPGHNATESRLLSLWLRKQGKYMCDMTWTNVAETLGVPYDTLLRWRRTEHIPESRLEQIEDRLCLQDLV